MVITWSLCGSRSSSIIIETVKNWRRRVFVDWNSSNRPQEVEFLAETLVGLVEEMGAATAVEEVAEMVVGGGVDIGVGV